MKQSPNKTPLIIVTLFSIIVTSTFIVLLETTRLSLMA